MTDAPLIIPADDPLFSAVRWAAAALFTQAMEIATTEGMAVQGSERGQAFYFAVTALLTEARLEPTPAANAIAAVVGAAAENFPDPLAAIAHINEMAQYFLRETAERRFVTDAEPMGRA